MIWPWKTEGPLGRGAIPFCMDHILALAHCSLKSTGEWWWPGLLESPNKERCSPQRPQLCGKIETHGFRYQKVSRRRPLVNTPETPLETLKNKTGGGRLTSSKMWCYSYWDLLLIKAGEFHLLKEFTSSFMCVLKDSSIPWSNQGLIFKCGLVSFLVNSLILFVLQSLHK